MTPAPSPDPPRKPDELLWEIHERVVRIDVRTEGMPGRLMLVESNQQERLQREANARERKKARRWVVGIVIAALGATAALVGAVAAFAR